MKETNKLIAEFMDKETILYDSKTNEPFEVNHTYHSDWNELIRAIEKIEDIRFDNEDKDSYVSYHRYDVDTRGIGCTITDVQEGSVVGYGDCATKRESTYRAIVEFIKFYNQNK